MLLQEWLPHLYPGVSDCSDTGLHDFGWQYWFQTFCCDSLLIKSTFLKTGCFPLKYLIMKTMLVYLNYIQKSVEIILISVLIFLYSIMYEFVCIFMHFIHSLASMHLVEFTCFSSLSIKWGLHRRELNFLFNSVAIK